MLILLSFKPPDECHMAKYLELCLSCHNTSLVVYNLVVVFDFNVTVQFSKCADKKIPWISQKYRQKEGTNVIA